MLRVPSARVGVRVGDFVIETNQLTRRFGDRAAVDRLDMQVRRGVVTGFLGPNGAGKTTTIRMLLGLIRPTSGTARVCGVDVTAARRPADKVGAIVETPAAYLSLSAFDNLRVAALSSGARRSRDHLVALLARVGLAGREREPVRGFSLGMKQRLGLAAALVHDPEVLFLDEPMNGLDPQGIVEMRGLLAGLCAEGKTIFVSSHALHEVQQTCVDVVVVARGQRRYAGPIDGLLGQDRLRVRATDAVRAATVLSTALANVRVERADEVVDVYVDAVWAPEVVRALVHGGVDVLAVEPVRAALEESFFAITADAPSSMPGLTSTDRSGA
jgi:ABC-2 type transport system ATP-binding protein